LLHSLLTLFFDSHFLLFLHLSSFLTSSGKVCCAKKNVHHVGDWVYSESFVPFASLSVKKSYLNLVLFEYQEKTQMRWDWETKNLGWEVYSFYFIRKYLFF
jgi:hypothetical protein